MEYCKFKQLEERQDHRGPSYYVECEVCGIKIWIRNLEFKKKCGKNVRQNNFKKPIPQEPSLIQKAANYAKSTVEHIASGAELRTQEEIDVIINICRSCEFFKLKDAERGFGSCSLCGCGINSNHSHISNKLARKNESCPASPHRWGKDTPNP